jgi:hypothetical protein
MIDIASHLKAHVAGPLFGIALACVVAVLWTLYMALTGRRESR